jgi:5-methylthioadenosine/S-adenosylhomocysteine deaminase
LEEVDLLIEPRWVVPVRPRGAPLEQHAVAVRGGCILAVLPLAGARERFRARETVALPGHALLPGMVNAHAHSAMALLRGAGDDLPLERWLGERIWPLEREIVSAGFVKDGTRLAALEMLRAGITTCNDMYFFPGEAARALRSAGLRAVVGILTIDFPSRYAGDAHDYLHKGLAARDELAGDALVSFTLAPHAVYTCSDETLQRVGVLAEELDLPVHMHVHETREEIAGSLTRDGCRPLERLDRLGLVGPRLLAVHAVHLEAREIALLAERGASVAHCPASNLKLASGIAPVARLLAAGVNVAIGTDGAASNNRLDMLGETRLAALLAKAAADDAAALPAWQALECATLGGARALGLEDRIGSIEPGKQADLIAVDLSGVHNQPCYDPVSQLIYSAGREDVTDLWVAGQRLLADRRIADTDLEPAVLESAAPWQNQARRLVSIPPKGMR